MRKTAVKILTEGWGCGSVGRSSMPEGVSEHNPAIPAPGRWEQESQKFKIILSSIVNFRVWDQGGASGVKVLGEFRFPRHVVWPWLPPCWAAKLAVPVIPGLNKTLCFSVMKVKEQFRMTPTSTLYAQPHAREPQHTQRHTYAHMYIPSHVGTNE